MSSPWCHVCVLCCNPKISCISMLTITIQLKIVWSKYAVDKRLCTKTIIESLGIMYFTSVVMVVCDGHIEHKWELAYNHNRWLKFDLKSSSCNPKKRLPICLNGLTIILQPIEVQVQEQVLTTAVFFSYSQLQRKITYTVKKRTPTYYLLVKSRTTHTIVPSQSGEQLTSLYRSDIGKLYFGHNDCVIRHIW
jgi:hypothetical protein